MWLLGAGTFLADGLMQPAPWALGGRQQGFSPGSCLGAGPARPLWMFQHRQCVLNITGACGGAPLAVWRPFASLAPGSGGRGVTCGEGVALPWLQLVLPGASWQQV